MQVDSIWQMIEANEAIIQKIIAYKKVPYNIARILANRGIVTEDALDRYYTTSKSAFHNPFELLDMQEAVDRILEARDKEEIICIYGDYDVDGITSTATLYMFLEEIGCRIKYYIPSRHEEGYGINSEAIDKIKALGVTLMISVDTGITAIEQVVHASKIALEVIITDHHTCQEILPDALAVINPKRVGNKYPFTDLAGVGVVFKLIQALSITIGVESKIWKYLDIVAIGTVADIVPLVDENRLITKLAFKTMKHTWNKGLAALLKVAHLEDKKMTAGRIGFGIGPRLNAAGRMEHANQGVDLLISPDVDYCNQVANQLDQVNKKRQALEKKILEEAIQIIESTMVPEKAYIIVVASEGWHHGVIGIVASRLVERYYRPVIILAVEGEVASGSARSIDNFSIFDALNEQKAWLNKFGGHEMAAGMSLDASKISHLAKALDVYGKKHMSKALLKKKIKIDMPLKVHQITTEFIEQLQELEPFGRSNVTPTFFLEDQIKQVKCIGQDRSHLRLDIGTKNTLQGIGFSMGNVVKWVMPHQQIQVICQLEINRWHGNKQPQMMLKAIRHTEETYHLLENILKSHQVTESYTKNFKKRYKLTREDVALCYRYFRHQEKLKITKHYYTVLPFAIGWPSLETLEKVFMTLVVLEELGLVTYKLYRFHLEVAWIQGKKVALKDSKMYNKFCNELA